MAKKPTTRRLRKSLIKYFDEREISDWDNNFIQGCINFQNQYPQLTGWQWDKIIQLKDKYRSIPTKEE